jgi:hypothetical protein
MNWRENYRRVQEARGAQEWSRTRVNYLKKQMKLAREFSEFLEIAHCRGYAVEILVAVDGQSAPSSIITGGDGQQLVKYLSECSAGQRLKYETELEQLLGDR